MATFYIIRDGQPERLQPRKRILTTDGTYAPWQAIELWSAEDLAAIDIYEEQAAAVPTDVEVLSRRPVWTGSEVRETVTARPRPAPPTRRERFDRRAAGDDPVTDAIIAGFAELKGVTAPEAKAWLRGLIDEA